METTQKIVFYKPFDIHYEQVEANELEVGDNSIMIRTQYSLISPGTELALYTGTHININNPKDRFAKYPFYPGYASVGEVVKTGRNVQNLAVGDRVFSVSNHATYNVVTNSADFVFKLPDGLSDLKALFVRLAAISMTSVIQSDIRIGDRVVVLGLGLVGNLASQLFEIQGARVIGVDSIGKRVEIAKETMIHEAILSDASKDLQQEIGRNGGGLPDIVVEATGNASLTSTALNLVRQRGQVVLLGSPRAPLEINIYEHIHRKGIRMTGAHEILQGADGLPARGALLQYVMDLITRGALRIDPLITHVLSANRAKEAYELLLNDKDRSLGVILDWR
jgi:2-desacetyl-2-hydroxyethyl bacteriochlorophyllide A dehydrogenase